MKAESSQLVDALARFDGRNTVTLKRIAAAHTGEPRFDARLWEAASPSQPPNVRVAATRILLRRAQENHSRLLECEKRLAELLQGEDRWEVCLHLMQMLDLLDSYDQLEPVHRHRLTARLIELAGAKKTLIRAWAIGLLARLGGRASPSVQSTVRKLIETAHRSGSASINARLRQVRAGGRMNWLD